MSEHVALLPVDVADVTILVDNSLDILMPSDEVAQRAPLHYNWTEREQLIAEHGYSLHLTVQREGRSESVLYDAGLGRKTVQHNMDVLEVRANDLRAVILSHGHADHHGGLEGIIQRIGRPRMPLILHPDVWRERRVVFPTGNEIHMPPPSHADLDREGAVVCHVKDKGLVVLSSCSHAGAINVLRHAQRLTGVDKIHAFVGGLHLSGGLFEPIIPRTLAELAALGPAIVVPGHCTGWKATHELARQLPQAYVQTSVGTRLHFA
jgi:7,8-dihydropterin-6-yl-methyl-4-(beta-D-ribofuranosyl)aminobenzene 5'-phosphate synthase